MSTSKPNIKDNLGKDFLASFVVFLVALPLCMGIALASGVPPALGLLSGIIGGIVVGSLAGSPLQVSGPAAGLAVIVFEIVKTHGLKMLGPLVLIAGIIQVLAAVFKVGRWFRAVSPAVIRGMLAGIGVLIFASQFHVMVDDKPKDTSLENLLTIPSAIYKGIMPMDGSYHHLAAIVGISTILLLIGWNKFKPKALKAVPGALVGVVGAVIIAKAFNMPINPVKLPDNLFSGIALPSLSSFTSLNADLLSSALALAVIASAESLLCATAVDKLHDGERTNYDKELFAQGVGNAVAGLIGALPITGVIVRSSANVEAGAKTRVSAIVHGFWLLGLVAFAPFVLQMIPTAALAAILVFTGWKLMNPMAIKELAKHGRSEVIIFVATVIAIVATNLLTGILIGIALAVVNKLWNLSSLKSHITAENNTVILDLNGVASFLTLPKLAEQLDLLPEDQAIIIDARGLSYFDPACVELVEDWAQQHEQRGHPVEIKRAKPIESREKKQKDEDIKDDGASPAPA